MGVRPISLLALVLSVGCTSQIGGEGGLEELEDGAGVADAAPDEPGSEPADASPGRVAITLGQTLSDRVTPLNSIGCLLVDDNDRPVENNSNSYYRVFDLAAEGIDRDLAIDRAVVGIEEASSPDGSQPVTLALYTVDGPLEVANLSLLGSVDVDVEDQEGTLVDVPIRATAPAGSRLVVEVHVEDSAGRGRLFLIGSNAAGQTAPGYLRASDSGCAIAEPTDLAELGFPSMHMILKVAGEY